MPPSKKNRGLGRGLSALMNDMAATEDEAPVQVNEDAPMETKSATQEQIEALENKLVDERKDPDTPSEEPKVKTVSIDRLIRNPDQPRKVFDRDKLDDLIASIQQRGVLQPILVRPITMPTHLGPSRWGRLQVVAGERRYHAALKAGLTSVPVIIRQLSDRDVLEIGVIENVQRADLNPIEEAMAYEKLISEFGRTQADIATTIGKSRVHVANTVRLLGLSERAREQLMRGNITAGHARALLAAKDPDALLEAIIENGWSVRDAESWVKGDAPSPKSKNPRRAQDKLPDILALEQKLRDRNGLVADIRHKGRGGEIRLKYRDLEEMERILKQIGGKE